jgi:hypothetical protein
MNGILIAGLLLCAAAEPAKVQCKDGTFQSKGKNACRQHGGYAHSGAARTAPPPGQRPHDKPAGKSPYSIGGKRAPKSDSRATAICNDTTFWRGELDASACEGHGGVKEPL